MDVYLWDPAAAGNIDPPADGAPEGWPWRQVTGVCREVMAGARRWYDDPEWLHLVTDPVARLDATTISVPGVDVTAAFPDGSRLRMLAGGAATDCQIVTAVVAGGDTLVTVALAEVPLGLDTVLLHAYGSWASGAFAEVGAVTGKVPLVEDIRPTAEETVDLDHATLGRVLDGSWRRIPIVPLSSIGLPDADGSLLHTLSLRLAVEMENYAFPVTLPALLFKVCLGPTGTDADDIVYSFPLTARRVTPTTEIIGLPAIPLGTPAALSRVSVYGRLTSSGLATSALVTASLDDITGAHVRKLR